MASSRLSPQWTGLRRREAWPTHHVDLQVDGETDVVGHVVLPHVHDVVQLVSSLLRGFLFVEDHIAALQDTANRVPLTQHTPLGLQGRPASTRRTRGWADQDRPF